MNLILTIPHNSRCPWCLELVTDVGCMITGNVAFCAECYERCQGEMKRATLKALIAHIHRRFLRVQRGVVFFVPAEKPPVALHLLRHELHPGWIDPRFEHSEHDPVGPLFPGLDEGLYETGRHVMPLECTEAMLTNPLPWTADQFIEQHPNEGPIDADV